MAGVDDGNLAVLFLDIAQKSGFLTLDEGCQADDPEDLDPGGSAVNATDELFLVTNHNSGARGEG